MPRLIIVVCIIIGLIVLAVRFTIEELAKKHRKHKEGK